MNEVARELLEHHFDTAFAATDGIKKLRELILTLAMQGKLVAQDPDDPPARELLKEIEAEKRRLVKEGKIKAPKPLPEIKPEEMPCALPVGWEWSTLAEVSLINPRNSVEESTEVAFVPMTLIGTGNDGTHKQESRIWSDVKTGFTHFAEGDIGVAKITPCFENSKACIFSKLKNGVGAGTTELHIIRPLGKSLAPRYVLAYLKSPQFLLVGQTKMTGTAGQKRLPKDYVESNPFPLPPIAEQQRIVVKIDQLMACCDELEKLRAEREQKRFAIHTAALRQLLDAQEQDSSADAWQFLTRHFSELYSVKENVAQLRKAILQLAVMGKLVPQDLSDLPARELLQEIEAETRRLVKAGKIKQAKPLPEIKPEEVPYVVPEGWTWSKFESIVEISSGITKGRKLSGKTVVSVPYLRVANVQRGYLNSSIARIYFAGASKQTTNLASINKTQLRGCPVPLPPLPEQHRIVAKIDQLMTLCDTLEQQNDAATGKQTELLSAVMAAT